ncbi:JAB domain-containing protein [Thalassobacillus pellis]|uniref:JAB domain-containing protein n=1 Tax=Thalassobacillus pellis TaxID=748008 RepID=UPI00196150F3|nr:DNA repair protein RadC [Thalassobacillus pellis]MBM7554507.1 DNA repair protein RadC [Thalassobacillus pellis]
MEKMYEIVRIKQVVEEAKDVPYEAIVRSPEDAASITAHFIGEEDREVFFALYLNQKNHIVAVHRVHVGTVNTCPVHPREVFKGAILSNAASIIVAHNHPSQEVQPSPEDIEVTSRLVQAGKIIGVEVLDHLIVNASGSYTSLKEKGYV